MKIRKKITLWISGTALLSSIAFSSIIFLELMEEPFKFIDKEIRHMAHSLANQMSSGEISSGEYDLSNMPYNPDSYWIIVKLDNGQTLYQSKLTRYTDLSGRVGKSKYLIEKNIPRSQIWLDQDTHDNVLFRVMIIYKQINNTLAEIRIGKPIETLEENLIELVINIGISLFICVLLIFCLSFVLAGRILAPISTITRLAREISQKSLDKRIPLKDKKDELYELSVSLNNMFDRLQKSFRRQKDFIGNAAHELKSPITLLMLAQEEILMNDDLSSPINENLTNQLETTRRMSHLIKNLLDLSRLEQQETLKNDPVDLTSLLNEVLEDYKDMLTEKQIIVQNDVIHPFPIIGDHEKLFRLLVNLIDNAIKYNIDINGTIIIKAKKFHKSMRLEIFNTGREIPKKDLNKVFEQFYRVEKSRSLSHGGSGLGLAISKKIVSLHHGDMVITNEPENLIKVSVSLPLRF